MARTAALICAFLVLVCVYSSRGRYKRNVYANVVDVVIARSRHRKGLWGLLLVGHGTGPNNMLVTIGLHLSKWIVFPVRIGSDSLAALQWVCPHICRTCAL